MESKNGEPSNPENFLKRLWKVYKVYKPLLKFIVILAIPILLLPLLIITQSQEAKAGYVLLLVSIYWCSEVLPLGITGLIPALLLPLLGVVPSKDVTKNYMKENIMLCLAAYTVAVSIEKWSLHKRIALNILLKIGFSPSRLLLGVMLTCMLLSMWINNTATATIMIPVVEAVLQQLRQHLLRHPEQQQQQPQQQQQQPAKQALDIVSTSRATEKSDNRSSIQSEALELGNINQEHNSEPPTEYITLTEVPIDGKMTEKQFNNVCKAMCLCVAYGATFGGSCTIIGTGAIILAKAQIEAVFENYGEDAGFTFAKWTAYALPLSAITMVLAWLWLQLYWFGFKNTLRAWFSKMTQVEKDTNQHIRNLLHAELRHLGKMKFAEKAIAVHFTIMVLLWFFRRPGLFDGWVVLFPDGFVGSSPPALLFAIWFFIFPSKSLYSKRSGWRYVPIMDVNTLSRKIPWHLFLLFGGGMAVADACEKSGLSALIGEKMTVLADIPSWLLVTVVCLFLSFFTEFTSNVAVISIVMPIMAKMSLALQLNPLRLMIPSTLACTYAFMLPVATPPNAIVFTYGHLEVMDMVKSGFVLNMLAVMINSIASNTWGVKIFSMDTMPKAMAIPVTP